MKKFLLFIFLTIVCNSVYAKGFDYTENARGWGDKVKITYARCDKNGWVSWWHYIDARNDTDYDLLLKIEFKRCRVRLISKTNKLSEKNRSKLSTVYKFVPAHSTVRIFDPKNYIQGEDLPYLKSIGNLDWGFLIYDVDAERM